MRTYSTVAFAVVGVGFGVAGKALLSTLKHSFNRFYDFIRRDIVVTISLIVITLALRTAINLYMTFDKTLSREYNKSIENDTIFTPIYIVLFTSIVELLPVATLLNSLYFSF